MTDNRTNRTLKDSVYASLKTMILTGVLQPGDRVIEIDLAKRLKVSRTPLREALNMLGRDGLMDNRPHQGFFVALFDLKAFEDSFEMREILDGYAAEKAAELIGAEDRRALQQIIFDSERLASVPDRAIESYVEEMRIGLDVHRIIARASGNAVLAETLSKILDRYQNFIWTELLWLDEWADTRKEHAEIVAAVCNGERDRAGQLARQHVRSSKTTILRFYRTQTMYRAALSQKTSLVGLRRPLKAPRNTPALSVRR
jgi:DNA-binding GntR family transcriptional regulator